MNKEITNILITGALGQIGTDVLKEFRHIYDAENVIATDIKPASKEILAGGPFHILDIKDIDAFEELIKKYNIDTIIHLAAILSGVGEKAPDLAWDINMNGTFNVLNLGVKYKMNRIFIPSSIAVWGPNCPKKAPQETSLNPTTMYGVTKVAGEVLSDYYFHKYHLDVRGVRFPGIISSETLPGGGTTDYAVDIYYQAVKTKSYKCFVSADTKLPMMYMPDCIKAIKDLLNAPIERLNYHSGYNLGAMSFTAEELAASIQKYIPEFQIEYAPDFRQAIADSWPDEVDYEPAINDWGWKPDYDLDSMTRDMLEKLTIKNQQGLI